MIALPRTNIRSTADQQLSLECFSLQFDAGFHRKRHFKRERAFNGSFQAPELMTNFVHILFYSISDA
jgi:hypothetical protein